MLSRLRNYFLVALAAGFFYFLLNHHIIIFAYNDFKLLKKIEPTLEHTFVSLKQAHPMKLLKIDPLRDAGIEEVMLERGMLTEQRLNKLLDIIDSQYEQQNQ